MNKLMCGDNLELMKTLPDSIIDLIYCDILYGTGKKFNSYDDISVKDINSFYEPRFNEMYRLLKPNGQIYIQCDYHANYLIRMLLEKIFPYFLNEIIWFYNSAPRKNNCFGFRHDTIFRYSKTLNVTFNEDYVREPYALSAPRGYEKEKYYNENGKVLGDVWYINILGQNDKTERTGYSTQKPIDLIDRIILSSSNENDLIADFFCGSGTTIVSAIKNNRQYLGIDNNIEAINITKQRIGYEGYIK